MVRAGFPDASPARPHLSFAEVFISMKNLDGLSAALRAQPCSISLQDFCTVEQLNQGPMEISISTEFSFVHAALKDWDPQTLRVALEFDADNDAFSPSKGASTGRSPHLDCLIAALVASSADEAVRRRACCRLFLEFAFPCEVIGRSESVASVLVACGTTNHYSGVEELASLYATAGQFNLNAPLDVGAPATMRGLTPLQSAIQHGNARLCKALLDKGCKAEAPPGVADLLEYARAAPDSPGKDLVVAFVAEALLRQRFNEALPGGSRPTPAARKARQLL
jgi:hypothetical protein